MLFTGFSQYDWVNRRMDCTEGKYSGISVSSYTRVISLQRDIKNGRNHVKSLIIVTPNSRTEIPNDEVNELQIAGISTACNSIYIPK